MTKHLCITIYSCILTALCCANGFIAGKTTSKQLLQYDEENNKFQLNTTGMSELTQLRAPITILAAIGDARVGKSTTLNHIQHIWRGRDERSEMLAAFQTSNQMQPCTRGVWFTVVCGTDGSTVFLDVEGSNLGDDTKTNQFSIFSALLSSGLMLFGEGTLTNHNRDFLFRLTRVAEEIWREELRNAAINQFPGLRVILRQPLNRSAGVTLADYVVSSLVGTNDEKAKVLKRYFPDNRIGVSALPTVPELKQSNGKENGLTNEEYIRSVMTLVKDLKNTPAKKTPSGSLMNAQMITDLATKLVEALNENSWLLMADTFTAMEKSLCENAFNTLVKPMYSYSLDKINTRKTDVLSKFNKQCVLNGERTQSQAWLEDVVRDKEKAEEKRRLLEQERKQREEEERKQRELEEQRKREEEEHQRRMNEERARREAEEQRRREEDERARRAEEERQRMEHRLAESRRAIKEAENEKENNDIFKAAAAILPLVVLFSDERLKQDIATLPGSRYEMIGLRGVTWSWNQKAQAMGLRGTAQGVVAQEVEVVYPEAVIEGVDGYKLVNYTMLQSILGTSLGAGTQSKDSHGT